MPEPVKSPYLAKYVDLLEQLHALVGAGHGDSAEAEVLRDEMDELWPRLGQREIAEAGRRSAELHSQRDATTASGKRAHR
jgi:hypothetical protein